MNHAAETARETALAKIREATEADFLCLIAYAKENLGADLAPWLDCSAAHHANSLPNEPEKWTLGFGNAALPLRFQESTEILVRYLRNPEGHRRHLTPYLNQEWIQESWCSQGYWPGNPFRSGRFAAVRYKLNHMNNLTQADFHEWVMADDIDHTKLAAKEFYKEKVELAEQVKQLKERAVLDRLRKS